MDHHAFGRPPYAYQPPPIGFDAAAIQSSVAQPKVSPVPEDRSRVFGLISKIKEEEKEIHVIDSESDDASNSSGEGHSFADLAAKAALLIFNGMKEASLKTELKVDDVKLGRYSSDSDDDEAPPAKILKGSFSVGDIFKTTFKVDVIKTEIEEDKLNSETEEPNEVDKGEEVSVNTVDSAMSVNSTTEAKYSRVIGFIQLGCLLKQRRLAGIGLNCQTTQKLPVQYAWLFGNDFDHCGCEYE